MRLFGKESRWLISAWLCIVACSSLRDELACIVYVWLIHLEPVRLIPDPTGPKKEETRIEPRPDDLFQLWHAMLLVFLQLAEHCRKFEK